MLILSSLIEDIIKNISFDCLLNIISLIIPKLFDSLISSCKSIQYLTTVPYVNIFDDKWDKTL